MSLNFGLKNIAKDTTIPNNAFQKVTSLNPKRLNGIANIIPTMSGSKSISCLFISVYDAHPNTSVNIKFRIKIGIVNIKSLFLFLLLYCYININTKRKYITLIHTQGNITLLDHSLSDGYCMKLFKKP